MPKSGRDRGGRVHAWPEGREAVREAFARVAREIRAARRADRLTTRRVHEIRVATRRAGAVLRAVGPFASESDVRRARRLLRAIRRSAAPAREADVHAGLIRARLAEAGADEVRGLRAMLKDVRGERRRGREALRRALERLTPGRVRRRGEAVARAIAPDVSRGRVAEAALTRVIDAIGGCEARDAASLHELRIAIKRARYAVEVLSPWERADEAGAAVGALSLIQVELGEINDASTLWERARGRKGRRVIAERLIAEMAERAGAFCVRWEGGLREEVVALLAALLGPGRARDERGASGASGRVAGGSYSAPLREEPADDQSVQSPERVCPDHRHDRVEREARGVGPGDVHARGRGGEPRGADGGARVDRA